MKTYNVWFQDSQILITVRARSNSEARAMVNRQIQIKQLKEQKEQ